MNPYVLDQIEAAQLESLEVELYYSTEWDEFWSFVGNKANIRWIWYVIEKRSGIILAWQNGRRTDEVLEKLLNQVDHLPIRISHTDQWGPYSRLFPSEYLHIVGKDNTWKIERKNLNFRTHLKRMDNVIGMYIEKYYFKQGQFADAFRA